MERRPGVCRACQDRLERQSCVVWCLLWRRQRPTRILGRTARSLWAPPQNPLLSGAHQNPSHFTDENLYQFLVKGPWTHYFSHLLSTKNEGPIKGCSMTLYCDLYLCSLTFSGELKGSALFKRSRPHLGFTPFIFAPLPQLDWCHIKPIYGPYMGHPHSKHWTLDFAPAFLQWFEPTIHFSYWSAVSPSKSRDFRLPEPTIPFSYWSAVKPRDFRLPEPTIPFSYWSAVLSPPSP